MNIHPLFVHFPIGILVLYVAVELLSATRLEHLSYWFPLRAILVIVGSLAAMLTLPTGEMAEHALHLDAQLHQVAETHSLFAGITTAVFGVLGGAYLITAINRSSYARKFEAHRTWRFVTRIANIIQKKPLRITLAVAGLAVLTITGGLGAAIALGYNVDPFVTFIYHLFF
jgi:uncharacterized membrane protein